MISLTFFWVGGKEGVLIQYELTDSAQLHPLQDVRYQGTGAGHQLAGTYFFISTLPTQLKHPSIHASTHPSHIHTQPNHNPKSRIH